MTHIDDLFLHRQDAPAAHVRHEQEAPAIEYLVNSRGEVLEQYVFRFVTAHDRRLGLAPSPVVRLNADGTRRY